MKALHILTFILTVLGALNWGLIALVDYNLVTSLLGSWPNAVKAVYLLIAASAVFQAVSHFSGDCRVCAHK